MLDIMEMRGFEVLEESRRLYLIPPDHPYKFAVKQYPHRSNIACAFDCFLSIHETFK